MHKYSSVGYRRISSLPLICLWSILDFSVNFEIFDEWNWRLFRSAQRRFVVEYAAIGFLSKSLTFQQRPILKTKQKAPKRHTVVNTTWKKGCVVGWSRFFWLTLVAFVLLSYFLKQYFISSNLRIFQFSLHLRGKVCLI